MALGSSCPCRFSCWNLLPIDQVGDKLVRDQGPTKDFHSSSTSLALFCNSTLGSALVFTLVSAPDLALTPAPDLAPTLASVSSNKLFRQFIKAYLESNQGFSRPPAEREQSFKAKVPDMYYQKLYIDYYHFCQ